MLPVSCLQLEVGNIAVALGGLQIWDILSSSPSHRADQPSVAGHNCVPVVSTRFSVSQQAVRFFFPLVVVVSQQLLLCRRELCFRWKRRAERYCTMVCSRLIAAAFSAHITIHNP